MPDDAEILAGLHDPTERRMHVLEEIIAATKRDLVATKEAYRRATVERDTLAAALREYANERHWRFGGDSALHDQVFTAEPRADGWRIAADAIEEVFP